MFLSSQPGQLVIAHLNAKLAILNKLMQLSNKIYTVDMLTLCQQKHDFQLQMLQ